MNSTEPIICKWRRLALTATRVFEHEPSQDQKTYRSIPLRQIDCLSLEFTENTTALGFAALFGLIGGVLLASGLIQASVVCFLIAGVIYLYYRGSRSTRVTIYAGQAAIHQVLVGDGSKEAIQFLDHVQAAIDVGLAPTARGAAS